MPRPSKPARLNLRKDRNGEKAWIILDRGRQIRTGCPEGDIAGAEKELSAYLADRDDPAAAPAQFPDVGNAIAFYLQARQEDAKDTERLFHCAQALFGFWAAKEIAEVTRANCRTYADVRRKDGIKNGTIRRELSMLQSALICCDEERRLGSAFSVWLPKKPPPRDRIFTRQELARLMRSAAPHLRRFILLSRYTGRRHRAVIGLTWTPQEGCGWIDLSRERIHFLPTGEGETAKRRGSIPIPALLLPHLRRWYKMDTAIGCVHVIHFNGKPMRSVRKALQAALKRAGLPHAVPHVLKHTAVTTYFENGGDLADGAEYFATTPETLMAVYRKHSPVFARRGAEVMGRRGRGG